MWPIIAMLILAFLVVFLVIAYRVGPRGPIRNPYLAYYEDGLWEAYFGLLLLLIGLAEWFEFQTIAAIPILLYPVLLATKQAITALRLDVNELPATDTMALRKPLIIAVVLTVLLVLATIVLMAGAEAGFLRSWLDRYLAPIVWLLVIGLFALWGYRTRTYRLIAYAGLTLAAFALSLWLQVPLSIYALSLGAIIFLSGLAMTVRFVRTHPRLVSG